MPILKPEIQKALSVVGLNKNSESSNITDKLDIAGLSLHETLSELADIMGRSDNDGYRLKAIEMVLKAHGVMKEAAAPMPSVTIIINDPGSSTSLNNSINPILIPRPQMTLESLSSPSPLSLQLPNSSNGPNE